MIQVGRPPFSAAIVVACGGGSCWFRRGGCHGDWRGLWWDGEGFGGFDGPGGAVFDALGVVGELVIDELHEAVGLLPGAVKMAICSWRICMP